MLAFCVRSPKTKVIVVQKTRDEQIDQDLQRLFPAYGFRLLDRILSSDAVRAIVSGGSWRTLGRFRSLRNDVTQGCSTLLVVLDSS